MKADTGLGNCINWVLVHSFQAGALVLLVLAVQWIFRRRLTNRWRFALWWIVLARLLLPVGPQSVLSLFNYVQPTTHLTAAHSELSASPAIVKSGEIEVHSSDTSALNIVPPSEFQPLAHASPQSVSKPVNPPQTISTDSIPKAAPPADTFTFKKYWAPLLAGLWLAGVLGLAGLVFTQLFRFRRKLTGATSPTDSSLQSLLDVCRKDFGISRPVQILETSAVQSPALYGLLRLKLLVPRNFGTQFNQSELRYIFLHELAHVKRGDLWLNWLVTVLQTLHWFNPLLWWGFARLRADRELACDELALLRAGDSAGTAYGETVVKLLESLNHPASVPGLVGILEDKQQMRQRIRMISNFQRPGRWSALAAILMAVIAAVSLTDAQTSKSTTTRIKVENDANDIAATNSQKTTTSQDSYFSPVNTISAQISGLDTTNATPRPNLTGTIITKDGSLLQTRASVFIATAAPKTGTSTFCPSCYADCIKHSQTDAQGHFQIESLDPQLTFRILAVAKGYQPESISKVDPAKGPVTIRLKPMNNADATPDRCLRGRVLDSKGNPVEGAVVEMVGTESKDGGGSYGALQGIDPLAVTDDNGDFLITSQKPFDMMDVKVSARTFATKSFTDLPSGKKNDLVMTPGATITGSVLADGKPLAGVTVGISGVNRRAGFYVGHFEISTDAKGKFAFINVPPDVDFWIYTTMNSMQPYGAVPIRQIHSGKDGATTDVGDLNAEPAHHLAGRVKLADGQPLPSKVRLLISRDQAWDSMQITLDAGGHFDVKNVPNELIDLSARVKGYHISARNLSVDRMNPYQLIGRMDRDITNLVFLLEKGSTEQPDYSHVDPDYNEIRNRTLRGAESDMDHSHDWTISGHVLDQETKQPVASFHVTPGQVDDWNRTSWSALRVAQGSNGTYTVYLSRRTEQPLLKVEADGYLPVSLRLSRGNATDVDFLLQKGDGPSGTVVTPDGKPAVGTTVAVLVGEMNEASLYPNGNLNTYGNRSHSHAVDSDGHFSFKPILNAKYLAAASTNGFALVNLESLSTNSTIRLEPFGQITGVLHRKSGPGTNEELNVIFSNATGVQTGINLQHRTRTDSTGHFSFTGVPTGHFEINHLVPVGQGRGSWTYEPLKGLDLKPGQKLEVDINAPDYKTVAETTSYTPPPLTRVAGQELKGVVLGPDGKPAADAEVALQLTEGPFNLSLAQGRFKSSGLREHGLVVNANTDGSFDIPLYEKAIALVAVNDQGYAQVSLDEFRQSSQIRLQKFGRIEGILHVGHRLGTNEIVNASPGLPHWNTTTIHLAGDTNDVTVTNAAPKIIQPLMYDFNAFQAFTDSKGKFSLGFIPPGEVQLWRKIPDGNRSWTQSQLATLELKPGAIVVTNVGGSGRTVVGKIQFDGDLKVDFQQGMGLITTPTFKIFQQLRKLKTAAERQAFLQSPEAQKVMNQRRTFSVRVAKDGSFRGEDILPGTYEFSFQPTERLDASSRAWILLASKQNFIVPAAKNQDDETNVNLGTIALTKRVLPMPGQDEKK